MLSLSTQSDPILAVIFKSKKPVTLCKKETTFEPRPSAYAFSCFCLADKMLKREKEQPFVSMPSFPVHPRSLNING